MAGTAGGKRTAKRCHQRCAAQSTEPWDQDQAQALQHTTAPHRTELQRLPHSSRQERRRLLARAATRSPAHLGGVPCHPIRLDGDLPYAHAARHLQAAVQRGWAPREVTWHGVQATLPPQPSTTLAPRIAPHRDEHGACHKESKQQQPGGGEARVARLQPSVGQRDEREVAAGWWRLLRRPRPRHLHSLRPRLCSAAKGWGRLRACLLRTSSIGQRQRRSGGGGDGSSRASCVTAQPIQISCGGSPLPEAAPLLRPSRQGRRKALRTAVGRRQAVRQRRVAACHIWSLGTACEGCGAAGRARVFTRAACSV